MDSDSDNEIGSLSDVDSDAELQRAFLDGRLKPGLNVRRPSVTRRYANDTAGLKRKTLQFRSNLDWLERMDVTNEPAPLAPELSALGNNDEKSIDDDFQREMSFYRQAQAAVLISIPKLKALQIPTRRPVDYFAEMAKSDVHMKQVREQLLKKELEMERRDKARKIRELKKYGKQVQREVQEKRQKEKRDMKDMWKKNRGKQTMDLGNDKAAQKKSKSLERKNLKDKKYGFGGQKKRGKYNTATSSADVSGFNSAVHYGRPQMKKGNGKQKQRPGKNKRQKNKNTKQRKK